MYLHLVSIHVYRIGRHGTDRDGTIARFMTNLFRSMMNEGLNAWFCILVNFNDDDDYDVVVVLHTHICILFATLVSTFHLYVLYGYRLFFHSSIDACFIDQQNSIGQFHTTSTCFSRNAMWIRRKRDLYGLNSLDVTYATGAFSRSLTRILFRCHIRNERQAPSNNAWRSIINYMDDIMCVYHNELFAQMPILTDPFQWNHTNHLYLTTKGIWVFLSTIFQIIFAFAWRFPIGYI